VPGMKEDAVVLLAGKELPQLLGREGQDRRHQAHQAVRDVPERGLRRAPRRRICGEGIQPVLDHVEVEGAEILGTERLQLLRHEMELVARVVRHRLLLHLRRHRKRVPVDLHQASGRHRVLAGIEVRGVGEQEPQGVADAAVALDHPLEDLV